MSRRTHLRTRVLLLTGAFAIVLFAITFGLSYRAKLSQERWSRLIRVETEAIAKLEEVTRAQNSFRVHGGNYRVVTQLLRNDALEAIDTAVLRARVNAFANVIADEHPRAVDLDATSVAIVREAQRIIGERKREI